MAKKRKKGSDILPMAVEVAIKAGPGRKKSTNRPEQYAWIDKINTPVPSWLQGEYPHTNVPEERLWGAVLCQGILDLKNLKQTGADFKDYRQWVNFFTNRRFRKDLEIVCAFSGHDPDAIADQARWIIEMRKESDNKLGRYYETRHRYPSEDRSKKHTEKTKDSL